MTSAAETAQLRSFQCDICMTKLPADTNAYVAHMKMHASSMSLKCSFCSQVFQGPQKLKAHMQKVHASETNEPEPLKTEATPVNALPGSMSTSSKTGVPMGGLPEDVTKSEFLEAGDAGDSQSSLGLSGTQPGGLPPSAAPSVSSGRVSAGSSIDDASSKRSGSTEGIKCALCSESFPDRYGH